MTELQELQIRIAIIKDVVTAGSALLAAAIAVLGLQAWREQLKGKTEYELAQKLLRATYRVRNAFAEVRVPAIFEGEMSRAVKEENIEVDPNLDGDKRHLIAVRAVYNMRWKRMTEAFVDLDALALEGEAIWGQTFTDSLMPLRNCVHTLANTISEDLERREHPEFGDSNYDRKEARGIMFATSTEKDNLFSNEIAEAVTKVENFLKPHLKI